MHSHQNPIIRREDDKDSPAVCEVNRAAFGRVDEADLVESLRTEGVVLVSLVAETEQQIVGHILFSQISIETADGLIPAAALAPLAVLPEYQRQGIGSRLVWYGLEALQKDGEGIVIVLGHPAYYSRFGFSSEKARSLESPFPPEAYLAIELRPGALEGIHGKVRYPAAFGL